jgi:hypothetical protein
VVRRNRASQNDERLSGSEAINFVLNHDTQVAPLLVGKVLAGKVLIEEFPALSANQKPPVHQKLPRLKRLKAWLTKKMGR